ncbi:MAG: HlyD family efflux transporter periplasmic adaptor subunit [Bacteroidota bacterium]
MAQRYENITFQKTLPKKLIWTGSIIILATLTMLFLVGWFLEYSDKVKGRVTLTTPVMPLEIPARTNGVLDFFVEQEQKVEKGTIIALVKNSIIPYAEVLKLEQYLRQEETTLGLAKKIDAQEKMQLGELKASFFAIKESLRAYNNFVSSNQRTAMIVSKKKRIQLYENRLSLLRNKKSLTEENLSITSEQVKRKERLTKDSIISELDLDIALQEAINKKIINLDNEEAINTIGILIAELNQEILEVESQYNEKIKTYKDAIQFSINQLQNDIEEWKNDYLIVANRSGKCIWSEYLTDEQYVQAGQTVCTIVPEDQSDPIAKMEIAMQGASKVAVGQEVNILLDNYPSNEFGILKGEVAKIATLPENSLLKVEVSLEESLISTYGYPLSFQQLAEGQGEIITNKMSFLERIWNEAKGRRLNR